MNVEFKKMKNQLVITKSNLPSPENDEQNDPKVGFSFKKLLKFTGPGFLMSIALLDPGNIESDLQSGTIAHYHLLWVLLISTICGLFVQILAARVGTVTGLNLADLCSQNFPPFAKFLLYLSCEIAIIANDMQAILGYAIPLYLISNSSFPLWLGVLATLGDGATFFFLDKYNLKHLDALFGSLITIMAATFGFEFFKSGPEPLKLIKGLTIPWCTHCRPAALLQGIAIIGSIVSPHNLYLHSALVKDRKLDRSKRHEVAEANFYVSIESAIALSVSLIINVMVTAVFARGLYGKTNSDIASSCLDKLSGDENQDSIFAPILNLASSNSSSSELFTADLFSAGIYLGCNFGLAAMYIWAIGIFAAGQSSTMTGTYAGQSLMTGFLNLSWPRWKRVIIIRIIAMIPIMIVVLSFGSDFDKLTQTNDIMNAIMSLMLPFALLPLMIFSSSKIIMSDNFANSKKTNIIISAIALFIITVNFYVIGDFFKQLFQDQLGGNLNDSDNIETPIGGSTWLLMLIVILVFVCYILFFVYLTFCYFVTIGFSSCLKIPFFGKLFTFFSQNDENIHLLGKHTISRSSA